MRTRTWPLLWSAPIAVFVLLMVLRPLPPAIGASLSYVVQSVTVLVACILMALRARSAAARLRSARRLISAALFFAALGGVLALLVRLASDGRPPVPSVADAVHFVFLPLCVAGLLTYPVSEDVPGSRAQMVLDGVVAAAALWFVTYMLLLSPAHVAADLPLPAALTILAYPASDVFVIAMAAGALHRVAPEARRELGLAAAGVSLYAISDIAYTILSALGTYSPDSWVGALAEVGLLLVVAAGAGHSGASTANRTTWSAWAGALPYLSVSVALAFAAALAALGDGLGQAGLILLLTVVIALLLRQAVGNRDRDNAVRRLRENRALFRSLVVASSDLMTLHSADGAVTYASPQVSRLTGIPAQELSRAPIAALVHPEDLSSVLRLRAELRRQPGTPGRILLRVRASDGSWRWCQSVARDLLEDPNVRGIVCNTRDVHDQHLLQQQVRHDARHDALTGLGNRAQARELLDEACGGSRRRGTVVALLDLDGFKHVNDTYGHLVGDAILVEVAHRLRSCARRVDSVLRLGGDEFLLLLEDDGAAEQVPEAVLQSMRRPVTVDDVDHRIGASIGLAHTVEGMDPSELLRHADLAMYAAKSAGRNRLTWFSPHEHEPSQRKGQLAAEPTLV